MLEVRDDDFLKRCCQELCQTLQLSQEPFNACVLHNIDKLSISISMLFKDFQGISRTPHSSTCAWTPRGRLNRSAGMHLGRLALDSGGQADPVDRQEPRGAEARRRALLGGPRLAGRGARGGTEALEALDPGTQGRGERALHAPDAVELHG